MHCYLVINYKEQPIRSARIEHENHLSLNIVTEYEVSGVVTPYN